MDMRKQLAKDLKRIRLKNKVTKYRLIQCGMTMHSINRIESGDESYTINTLLRYCGVIGAVLSVDNIKNYYKNKEHEENNV